MDVPIRLRLGDSSWEDGFHSLQRARSILLPTPVDMRW